MKIFMKIILPAVIVFVIVFAGTLWLYIESWDTEEFYPLMAANGNARAVHGFLCNYLSKSGDISVIPDGKYYFQLNVDESYDAAFDGTVYDLENYIGSVGLYGFCCVIYADNFPVQVYWNRNEFPEIAGYEPDLSKDTDSDRYLYRSRIGGFPLETVPPSGFFRQYEEGIEIAAVSAAFIGIISAALSGLIYIIKKKKSSK